MRAVRDVDFLPRLVRAVGGNGVPFSIGGRVAAVVRVVEVVHEGAHGVAVGGGEEGPFAREPWVGVGEVGVGPVEGTGVDCEPGVGEEGEGDGVEGGDGGVVFGEVGALGGQEG